MFFTCSEKASKSHEINFLSRIPYLSFNDELFTLFIYLVVHVTMSMKVKTENKGGKKVK